MSVEMIVVDNGSTDESLARLRESIDDEERLRILENGTNLGFARAANRGLTQARGAWILLLNPDCLVEAETIAHMREAVESRPDVGLAGGLVLDPDGTEQAGCRREQPTPDKALVRALGLGTLVRGLGSGPMALRDFVRQGDPLPEGPVVVEAISGAFMFARRRAMEEVGGLDEGYFLHCEDLDWCERFRRAGWRVLFVPGARVLHERGVSSRGRPVRVLWHKHRGMIRYYRKFLRDRYPRPLGWLVTAAVWLRFGLLAALTLARRGLARVTGR
jgi:hypothetical protein